ncbi:hypothetical protein [Actinoalloteichus caeruleus]|uniref:Uncharacterized protein n=1 Tax=Actinoalloteichus caeruleus DSM 43889 TaxID=1120930 RepID=A0ABT1JH11_ACTCY|nr:hypothetical protein [Actinoalloteichus caeruleus]MCP2331785.1 hypothetical protein [Actinoalloteichus caeruleus DSM 43889]
MSFYDTYWTYRAYEEFETMFGRKPFSWVVGTSTLDEEELHDQYRTLFRSEYDRVVTHFGQGRLNPATLACLIAEIERAIASQHGVALPASSERHMNNRFFQLVTTGT